jgi:uncharacterized protein (DUF1697 family)
MSTVVAFLRAVNVSPRWITMAELREFLTGCGYADVETYIHSGNVRVTWSGAELADLEVDLSGRLSERFGFEIPVMARTVDDVADVAAAAHEWAPADDLRRYVVFCSTPPAADRARELEAWPNPGEWALVRGRDVLLGLSVGFHQAKLTGARIERLLGVSGTARDLKVVSAIAERWA